MDMTSQPEVQEQKRKETWTPDIAGILNIIVGLVCGILGYLVATYKFGNLHNLDATFFPANSNTIFAISFFFFAILAIIGGIFCIGRKIWGVAIAGSAVVFMGLSYCIANLLAYMGLTYIAAFFIGFEGGDPSFYTQPLISPIKIMLLLVVIAFAAIVLTIIGRKEFE